MDAPTPSLDAAALRRLSRIMRALQAAGDRAVPMAGLVRLADELPAAVGLTIDFAAASELGHPLVVLQTPRPAELPSTFSQLSRREREVLALLVTGLTNKEIAHQLSISLGTVKDHVHHILAKTGLPGRSAVIAAYLRQEYDGPT